MSWAVLNPTTMQTTCEQCGQLKPDFEIVHYGSVAGGYRLLCNACLNREVAEKRGVVGFEEASFKPMDLADGDGAPHTFHVRTRLYGDILALDAFELECGSPGGYKFQMLGKPEDDLLALLGRLVEKMRRGLARRHVVDEGYGPQIEDKTVRGRIDYDPESEKEFGEAMPAVVIDGRTYSWQQFGRMLSSVEGFQFRLDIVDMGDEV